MEIKHPIGVDNELAMLSGFKSSLVGTWHNEFVVHGVSTVPSQTSYGAAVRITLRRYGNDYVHIFTLVYPYCTDHDGFMAQVVVLVMAEIETGCDMARLGRIKTA